MADCMTFPDTVEEFMEQYKVVDTERIYTNGTEFVPIYRIKQWFEHLSSAQPKRKKGHWIRHITTGLGPKLNDTIECSECGIAFSTENMFRRSICPNCGADMRD